MNRIDSWTLYFHDPLDDNWTHSGYKKLFTTRTVGEFWTTVSECTLGWLQEAVVPPCKSFKEASDGPGRDASSSEHVPDPSTGMPAMGLRV